MIKKSIITSVIIISFIFIIWAVQGFGFIKKNNLQINQIRTIVLASSCTGKNLPGPKLKIVFFGDVMYDRGVSYFLTSDVALDNFLSGAALIASGSDFAGFNLETPVVQSKKDCLPTYKSVHFCSTTPIIPAMARAGFNLTNLANNHAFDGGVQAHTQTLTHLKNNNISYIGYMKHGRYYQDNYILTGTYRNMKYAWHGYDFTLRAKEFDKYCETLSKYDKLGYHNFLTVHRGPEYKQAHSARQEELAHSLIDCGAHIIIGHHPHVIQDIGYYKSRPIIYSLGNFVFDQGFSEPTQVGGYVMIDYYHDKTYSILTGTINAHTGRPSWMYTK